MFKIWFYCHARQSLDDCGMTDSDVYKMQKYELINN